MLEPKTIQCPHLISGALSNRYSFAPRSANARYRLFGRKAEWIGFSEFKAKPE